MKLLNNKQNFLKFKNSILGILLLFGIISISACSSDSYTSTNTAGSDDSNTLTGVFIDSPVKGLYYQTVSMSGMTDNSGTFMYHEGELISFFIGDVMLGSALAKQTMTPIDLVPGALDETHPIVTNICRLLQSLDWDADLTNGITITDAMHTEISGRIIDFSKSPGEFFDYDLEAFFNSMTILGMFSDGGHRELRTSIDAQNHFRRTLMNNKDNMHYGG